MSYNNSSTRVSSVARGSSADRAIASILVAGVTFILGYTVVRASLAQAEAQGVATTTDEDVQVVVPGEGTLWADFGTQF
ncbi:MAG: hypothetical protein WA885_24410 [Phormidesmis sp.]